MAGQLRRLDGEAVVKEFSSPESAQEFALGVKTTLAFQ